MKKDVIDHQAPSDKLKTFTRMYAYDGNERHLEFNGTGELLARYTHSTLRTDDVLAMDVNSSSFNYLICNLLDADGRVFWTGAGPDMDVSSAIRRLVDR